MTELLLALIAIVAFSVFLLTGPPPKNRVKGPEARRLVGNGAVLLDVRTPEEFATGHIDGAINIPVDDLDGRLSEVGDKDKPVIVYCRSGSRSARAAKTLARAGYAARDLGPMTAW
jgi:phage shock protein E